MTDLLEGYVNTLGLPAEREEELRARLMAEIAAPSAVRGRRQRPASLRRHLRRRVVLVGAVASVVAAGTLLLTEALPAAAWSPRPTELSPAQAAEPTHDCRAALATAKLPNASAQQSLLSGTQTIIAERRGTSTSVILGGSGVIGECVGTAEARLVGVVTATPLMPGQVLNFDNDGGTAHMRLLFGQVDTSVVAVTVRTGDGQVVEASVQNGYYLAWWPSLFDATSVVATGRAGQVLANLAPPGFAPNGVPPTPVSEQPGTTPSSPRS